MDCSKLIGLLAEKGITQEKFASSMGITRQTVRNKLNGNRKWTLDDIRKAASVLNLTPYDIVEIFFADVCG